MIVLFCKCVTKCCEFNNVTGKRNLLLLVNFAYELATHVKSWSPWIKYREISEIRLKDYDNGLTRFCREKNNLMMKMKIRMSIHRTMILTNIIYGTHRCTDQNTCHTKQWNTNKLIPFSDLIKTSSCRENLSLMMNLRR